MKGCLHKHLRMCIHKAWIAPCSDLMHKLNICIWTNLRRHSLLYIYSSDHCGWISLFTKPVIKLSTLCIHPQTSDFPRTLYTFELTVHYVSAWEICMYWHEKVVRISMRLLYQHEMALSAWDGCMHQHEKAVCISVTPKKTHCIKEKFVVYYSCSQVLTSALAWCFYSHFC